jgi:hypothetical protein
MTTLPPCGHSNGTHPSGCWYVAVVDAVAAERARIRAAVEALPSGCHSHSGLRCEHDWFDGWCSLIEGHAVLRIIDGGTP